MKRNTIVSFVTVENVHVYSSETDALLRQLVPLILYILARTFIEGFSRPVNFIIKIYFLQK